METALAQDDVPDPVLLVNLLSSALIELGQADQAEQCIRDAAKRFPDQAPDLNYLLATTLISLGDQARGEQVMRDNLVKHPDHGPSNNGLGYAMLMRLEDVPKALTLIQHAVDSDPTNEAYLDSLGWAYYKLGRFEDAEVWLRKAKEAATIRLRGLPAGPGSATLAVVHDHLGDALQRLGRAPEALQCWVESGSYLRRTSPEDVKQDPELASLSDRLAEKIKAVRAKEPVPVAETQAKVKAEPSPKPNPQSPPNPPNHRPPKPRRPRLEPADIGRRRHRTFPSRVTRHHRLETGGPRPRSGIISGLENTLFHRGKRSSGPGPERLIKAATHGRTIDRQGPPLPRPTPPWRPSPRASTPSKTSRCSKAWTPSANDRACTSATPPRAVCTTWSTKSLTTPSTNTWPADATTSRSRSTPDGSVSIMDDGSGIPVGPYQHPNPKLNGRPTVEIVMTVLHAGGKFDHDSYKVSGGLHGVGASVVNALSEYLEVEVARDGKLHAMSFERGVVSEELHVIGERSKTGTKITFKPDPQMFPEVDFRFETLAGRLKELGVPQPRLQHHHHRRTQREDPELQLPRRDSPRSSSALNEGKNVILDPPIYFKTEDPEQNLVCEIAIQYNDSYNEALLSFANNINTIEGGTHLSAFKTALTRSLNTYARNNNILKNDSPPSGDDLREGLAAIVSVKVAEPQFEGPDQDQARQRRGRVVCQFQCRPGARRLAGGASPGRQAYLHEGHHGRAGARGRPESPRTDTTQRRARLRRIARQALPTAPARTSANRKSTWSRATPAGGSAKGGRDHNTQAILPLKGKILNVEKARPRQDPRVRGNPHHHPGAELRHRRPTTSTSPSSATARSSS